MKFFKNFFRFRKDIDIFEQNKPNVAQDVDRVVGGMGEEKLDIKAKGKNRLDYSKKAKETEEMWKGKNYDTQWKPFVDDNLNDPKTFDKVVDFLKNYQGQKNAPVIKKILTDAEKKEKSGQGSVKDRVKELATDGRPGPFHTAVLQAIKKATDKVEPLEPKQAKIQVKDEEEKKVKGVPVDTERTKQYVDKIDPKQAKLSYTAPEEERKVKGVPVETERTKQYVDEIDPKKSKLSYTAPEEERKVKGVPVEEPKKKAKKLKVYRDDDKKSETSDQATGHVGEKEKIEMRYKTSGENAGQQLLNFEYPVNMKDEINLAKFYFTDKIFVADEKNVLNIEFTDKNEEIRFVYILVESGSKKYPVQIKGFRMNSSKTESINYTPRVSGKIKIKMIVSTVEIDLKYFKVKEKGVFVDAMSNDQCKIFLDSLLKERKPFSEVKSGKPVFQTLEQSFKVNPKQEYEPDKSPELGDFEKPKEGEKATRVA